MLSSVRTLFQKLLVSCRAPQSSGEVTIVSIAQGFSICPAGRFPEDGPYNGTTFRENVLIPRLNALGESGRLEVSLDGIAGVASSFLDEAFGGLVRSGLSREWLQDSLIVSAEDDALQDFARLAHLHIDAPPPRPDFCRYMAQHQRCPI